MWGMEIIGKRLAEKRMRDTTTTTGTADLRKDIRFISEWHLLLFKFRERYFRLSEGKHNNNNA